MKYFILFALFLIIFSGGTCNQGQEAKNSIEEIEFNEPFESICKNIEKSSFILNPFLQKSNFM